MKKKLLVLLMIAMAVVAIGCGSQTATDTEQTAETQQTPPNLIGEWKQVNSGSDTSYQSATIQDNTIEIYWVDEETETKSLYWAGSFVAPTTADEPYTWDSENDTEKTSTAIMASSDTTKTMTYENDQISYETSIMGTTQTVRLEKVEN